MGLPTRSFNLVAGVLAAAVALTAQAAPASDGSGCGNRFPRRPGLRPRRLRADAAGRSSASPRSQRRKAPSSRAAARGPRIVVFEVGGVIDLGAKTLTVREPFVTIAGQTAPSPGITLIRGGIDLATHDVIVQHIRVRPGMAGAG